MSQIIFMGLRILADKLVVKKDLIKSETGLILPDKFAKAGHSGTVIAMGNKITEGVKIGDKAYFNVTGINFEEFYGEDAIMLFEREVLFYQSK